MPGLALYAGQTRDVLWNSTGLTLNGVTTPDGIRFKIPEDGVYYVTFTAAVYGSTARSVGENLYASLYADNATGQGVSGTFGRTVVQHQMAGSYTTISVSVSEYFTKGTYVKAQVYLDSGATGQWWVAPSSFDAGFDCTMLSPSSNGWAEPAVAPGPLTKWEDNSYISVDAMNAQTTDVFAHLENRPRVTARTATFNVASSQEKVALPWQSVYANDPGFVPQRAGDGYADRTAIRVPYSGIYLVSLYGTVRHLGGFSDAAYGFQFKIHGESPDAKIMVQNSTTRINQPCSAAVTDVITLRAGEGLNVRFYGWGPDTRWASSDDDSRAFTLGAVYLGG
ncbi:hypothetical protein [Streptomyces sp. NPDC059928]|uniref:hypothetical protein n=1 Tax=unclassified Streptomyces TaxID=2593676 RepID=UPI00365392AA